MNPNVPPEGVTEEMILAAQDYDMAHRGESIAALWKAVPDRQVARLIAGALPLIRADAGKRRIPGSELYMAGVNAERERCLTMLRAAAARLAESDASSSLAYSDAADLIEGER